MDPSKINWLAVAAAAVSTFLVGGVWFSPLMFGKAWMEDNGLREEELKRGMGRVLGGSLLLALVMAVNLAFFLGESAGAGWGAAAGALAGIGWAAAALWTTYLFERRPLRLALVNGGYLGVSFTLMGLIIGVWS